MSKRQINIRISKATDEKLSRLIERHGTLTEVVAVAIHQLDIREQDRTRKNAPPQEAPQLFTCEECEQTLEWNTVDNGLPPYWMVFALAQSGEQVEYTDPTGREYASANSWTFGRPHIVICPKCAQRLWPWI